MIKYVITGGPCVGKTTTLNELKREFSILDETARIIIQREQEKEENDPSYVGCVPYKRLYDFQVAVAEMQMWREEVLDENLPMNVPVFLDRSLVDNIAFARIGGVDESPNIRKNIENAKYQKVFFLEHLGIYEKDGQRRESMEYGLKVHNEIRNVYKELGFNVIDIPAVSVEERISLIKQHIA